MKNEREYRDALGRFPTGVALITLMHKGEPKVMTVNSFASVSLNPPLILWSLDHASYRYDCFLNAEYFAVNVLADDQKALSNACARDDVLVNSGAQWREGRNGAPLVEDCIARFECSRHSVVTAGDHDIILGQVTDFDLPRQAASLVFVRSDYAKA